MRKNTLTIVFVLLALLMLTKAEAKPPASPASVNAHTRLVYAIVERINNERARLNLLPLKLSTELTTAAENHAQAMVEHHYFDTLTPDGRNASVYAFEQGFNSLVGQNIYRGEADPDLIISSWLSDEIDCDNLLDPTRNEVGIGYAASDDAYGSYVVLDIGQRTENYPVVINREAYETTDPHLHLSLYGEGVIKRMRFSVDGKNFTDWEPFHKEHNLSLPAVDGNYTVYVEFTDGVNFYANRDSISLYRHLDGKNLE